MGGLPTYHPEWVIRFWFGTPGLRELNPHYTLFFLAIILLVVIYFKRKLVVVPQPDVEENRFKHLLTKKNVIEKQMAELELRREQNNIPEEQYKEKLKEFQKHLEQTKQELHQFTL
ncbi:hypothetical protein [Mesobacillus maritimus]|uniref:hypothetical protein n=1 Tax=Mesobacillus maritimus TaxID=1643336 RepID=UPI00384C18C1